MGKENTSKKNWKLSNKINQGKIRKYVLKVELVSPEKNRKAQNGVIFVLKLPRLTQRNRLRFIVNSISSSAFEMKELETHRMQMSFVLAGCRGIFYRLIEQTAACHAS